MSTCEIRTSGSGPIVDCHRDAGEVVGADIAGTALRDPALGRKMLEQMFLLYPGQQARREVARGLAEGLPLMLLSRLAESKDGHAMLESALAELKGGDGDNAWAADQISTALKTADLKNNDAFKKLDATSKQTILDRLNYSVADPAAVDNLIALATSGGFGAAPPDTRKALLSALAEHPDDAVFGDGLQNLAKDPDFKKLAPTEQGVATGYFKSVAHTPHYNGRETSFPYRTTTPSDSDKRAMLDNARQLVVSRGFERSPPFVQLAAMQELGGHATNASFTRRLVALLDDPGFAALSDASKQTMLVDAYGSDSDFAKGLDTVMGSGNYRALGGADRAKVLDDMAKLHGTSSYKKLSDSEQQTLVEILGNVSAQSAAEPGNKILRNTLDQVFDGKVKIGVYKDEPYKGADGNLRYEYGKSNDKGVFINIDDGVRATVGSRKDIDTLAHEMNHYLNDVSGDSESGSVERFLDEYRAFLVGREAELGRKLTPDEQKAVLDNLVDGNSRSYRPLAYLYKNLPWFNTVVNDMYATFAGKTDPKTHAVTPPATFDAEQVRTSMLKVYSTDYLKKTGNLDNH